MTYHYTYMLHLLDDSRYIGSRSCDCDPEEDDYWGSASDPYVCKENVLRKQIIDTFPTRKEANEFERFLHQIYCVDISEKFRNKVIAPSADFDRSGRPSTPKQIEAARKTGHMIGKKYGKKNGQKNRGKPKQNNSTGVVGVSLSKKLKKFQANITFENKQYCLGTYSNLEEASEAYQKALSDCKRGIKPSKIERPLPVSGFQGVARKGRGWATEITIKGKRTYLGTYDSPEKAHEAFLKAKSNPQNVSEWIKPTRPVSNETGFLGVKKSGKKYVARIRINNKEKHLGTYATAEEASAVYNKVLKKVLAGEDPSSVYKKRIPSSKYRNVCWFKHYKKWRAEIRKNRKLHHLGYFENEIDAAFAVKEAHLNLKLRELTDTA